MGTNPATSRRRLLVLVGGAVATTAGCLGNDDDSTDDSADDSNSSDADESETEGERETETESRIESDTEPDSEPESESGDGDGEGDDSTDPATEDDGDDGDELHVVEHDYSTLSHEGHEVPLMPVEDAHEWYDADEAYVVDTRGQLDFAEMHVTDALWSPAPDGLERDPIDELERDAVLVTYCDCPHDIAVRRSASLLEEGYVNVFVLEGGLEAWHESGYPVSGGAVD